jgi:hypothetical protein
MTSITITNKRICDFYEKNPSINIETINLILLDLLEEISADVSKLVPDKIHSQILSELKDIKTNMNILQDSLLSNMSENNKSFIDSIKMTISLNGNSQNEKISSMLDKCIDTYIDKLNIIIPKSTSDNNTVIQDYLLMIQKTIQMDIQGLLLNKDTIHDFIQNFDTKLTNLNQPLYTLLLSNQTITSDNIKHIHSECSQLKATTEKISCTFNEYVNKFNSSFHKGDDSEKKLFKILENLFRTDKIINTTSEFGKGDFILNRNDNDYILFETKSFTTSVHNDEVNKFMRDIHNTNLHGVFMSQYSNINNIEDYRIEVNKGCILVFITNVNFCPDKIRSAVDIIDHLDKQIKSLKRNTDKITIRHDVMNKINEQYKEFVLNKEKLLENFKEQCRINTDMTNKLILPNLSRLLNSHYKQLDIQHKCKHCDYITETVKELTSHMKAVHPFHTMNYNNTKLPTLRKLCDDHSLDHSQCKNKSEVIALLKTIK